VGIECYGANDAEAAVKIVSTTAGIRLIITDFQMPGETGAYLVRAVETKWEGEHRRKKRPIRGHPTLTIRSTAMPHGGRQLL
jgi:CheY-like chemotaxis protein